jgi:hypothetical protein
MSKAKPQSTRVAPEECVPSCGGKLFDRHGKDTSRSCFRCSRTFVLVGEMFEERDPLS